MNPSQAIVCAARCVAPKQRHTHWRFTQSVLLQSGGQEKKRAGQQDTLFPNICSRKVAIEEDATKVQARAVTLRILPLLIATSESEPLEWCKMQKHTQDFAEVSGPVPNTRSKEAVGQRDRRRVASLEAATNQSFSWIGSQSMCSVERFCAQTVSRRSFSLQRMRRVRSV